MCSSYSHYFEGTDSANVTSMLGNIQEGSSGDQGNGFQLKFIISCENTANCDGSLAVTDAAPITDSFTPIIRLCPLFLPLLGQPISCRAKKSNEIRSVKLTAGVNQISRLPSSRQPDTPSYTR